jgi:regulator of sigma E protease
MSILLLILGLFLFIGLIVIHEWGHFIMARRNGVDVEEFGIFFPPRLYKHETKHGWLFTINLLPLGGFVKLKGEHDSDTVKGSFGAATVWAKTKIMAAGVFMNLVVAVVLLTIVALVGMPQLVPNQFTVKSDTKSIRNEVIITYVEPNSPAAKAGIKSTDQIETIGTGIGKVLTVTTVSQLKYATQHFAGQRVDVVYKRAGITHSAVTTLLSNKVVAASQKTNNPKGQLGVSPQSYSLLRSTWSAPVVAVGIVAQFTVLTIQGLGHAIAGLGSIIAGSVTHNVSARQNGQAAAGQVSGPVGIYFLLQTGSLLGYQFILMIVAIISLTLAIMNILPIPALDGGRLWLTLVTRALKKPLTPRLEERINATGFAILMVLIVVITVVDIRRFF